MAYNAKGRDKNNFSKIILVWTLNWFIKIIPYKGFPIGEAKIEDEIGFVFAPIGETRILATGEFAKYIYKNINFSKKKS